MCVQYVFGSLTCIMYIDCCVCAVCIWVINMHHVHWLLCVCAVCIWVVHVQRQHLQAAGHLVEALSGLGKPRKQPYPHPYNVQLEVSHTVLIKCSHFVNRGAKGVGTWCSANITPLARGTQTKAWTVYSNVCLACEQRKVDESHPGHVLEENAP